MLRIPKMSWLQIGLLATASFIYGQKQKKILFGEDNVLLSTDKKSLQLLFKVANSE